MIDWHYKSWGNSKNPCIVFLHGFLGRCSDWDHIIPHFEKEYFCLAVDLPGHDQTLNIDETFDWSMESTSKALIEYLAHISINSFSLVGYSMGARIALYTALNYPQTINKLVLESCSPGIELAAERSARVEHDQKWAAKILNLPPNQFLIEWYNQPIFESLLKHTNFSKMLAMRTYFNPELAAKSLMGLSQGVQPPLWDKLRHLNKPVLLISGENDKKYVSLTERMNKELKNCSNKIIESAGHNTHFEQPQKFIKVLKEFFLLTQSFA